MQIHAPEDDVLFHDEPEEQIPTDDQEQPSENSAVGGEPRGGWDNMPQRVSLN